MVSRILFVTLDRSLRPLVVSFLSLTLVLIYRVLICSLTVALGSGENRQTWFYVRKALYYYYYHKDTPRGAPVPNAPAPPDEDIRKAIEVMQGGERSILEASCKQLSTRGGLWSTERRLRSSDIEDNLFLDDDILQGLGEEEDYSLFREVCRLFVPSPVVPPRDRNDEVMEGVLKEGVKEVDGEEGVLNDRLMNGPAASVTTMTSVFSFLIDQFEWEFDIMNGKRAPDSYFTARDAAKLINAFNSLAAPDEEFLKFKISSVMAKVKNWFFKQVTSNFFGSYYSPETLAIGAAMTHRKLVIMDFKAIKAYETRLLTTERDFDFSKSLYLRSTRNYYQITSIRPRSWQRLYSNGRGGRK